MDRELDVRPREHLFEPQWRLCIVTLSKTLYPGADPGFLERVSYVQGSAWLILLNISEISHEMKYFGLKMFQFYRIFKNGGQGGGSSEPMNPLWISHCVLPAFYWLKPGKRPNMTKSVDWYVKHQLKISTMVGRTDGCMV